MSMEEFGVVLDRTIKECARKVEARLQRENQTIVRAMQEGSHLPDNYWHERHAAQQQLRRIRELFL